MVYHLRSGLSFVCIYTSTGPSLMVNDMGGLQFPLFSSYSLSSFTSDVLYFSSSMFFVSTFCLCSFSLLVVDVTYLLRLDLLYFLSSRALFMRQVSRGRRSLGCSSDEIRPTRYYSPRARPVVQFMPSVRGYPLGLVSKLRWDFCCVASHKDPCYL